MGDYDGFNTVDDPRDYMNAPAMIMPGASMNNASPPNIASFPLIVQAAIEYASPFHILSSDELQRLYSEKSALQRRCKDLKNRLEVEFKMCEAAQSLSKLHAEDAGISSPAVSPNKIAGSKRLSKLLSSQHTHEKSDKRLSRQAADEAAISAQKITDLEKTLAGAELRRSVVENQILQHHAGVLSSTLSGKPLPVENHHQRNRSNGSTSSFTMPYMPSTPSRSSTPASGSASGSSWNPGLVTPKSTATPRQSWMMATPKHQRQWSSASNADAVSLATVNEHPPARRPVDDEIDLLASKVATLLPQASPNPSSKVEFISSSFDAVLRELDDTKRSVEVSRGEMAHHQQTIAYLESQLESASKRAPSSNTRDASTVQPEYHQLQQELDNERSVSLKWRNQFEKQRKELLNTTRSLEEVTKMAVEFEGERADFELLVKELDKKISSLESEKVNLMKQRLGSSANSSLLCQEFQQIVADMVTKHEKEVRDLYPKFKSSSRFTASSTPYGGPAASTPSSVPRSGALESSALASGAHASSIPASSSPASDAPAPDALAPDAPASGTHASQIPAADVPASSVPASNTPYSKATPNKAPSGNVPASSNAPLSPRAGGPHDEYTESSFDSRPVSSVEDVSTLEPVKGLDLHKQEFNDVGSSSERHLGVPTHPTHQKQISQSTIKESSLPNPDDEDLSLPRIRDDSMDDSIQHTSESLMRPDVSRHDSEFSEYSKSSSYYPDGETSANPSQSSVALREMPPVPQKSDISLPIRQNIREQSFDFDNDDDDDELL